MITWIFINAIHAYLHAYIHSCTHWYMHTFIHKHIKTYTFICIYSFACTHTHTHKHESSCICSYSHTCLPAYVLVAVTLVFVCSGAEWQPAPVLRKHKFTRSWGGHSGRAAHCLPAWSWNSKQKGIKWNFWVHRRVCYLLVYYIYTYIHHLSLTFTQKTNKCVNSKDKQTCTHMWGVCDRA